MSRKIQQSLELLQREGFGIISRDQLKSLKELKKMKKLVKSDTLVLLSIPTPVSSSSSAVSLIHIQIIFWYIIQREFPQLNSL